MMRRSLLAFFALAIIAAVGCFNESTLDPFGGGITQTGGSGGGGDTSGVDSAGAADTASIVIFDNGYSPTAVTVAPGGSVTWTWTGGNAHSVVFDNTDLTASTVQTVGTFKKVFPTAGIYSFYCSVHGRTVMSGVVTVK